MSEYGIHHVPIVHASILVGIVSFTDMMELSLVTSAATEHTIDTLLDQQFSIKDIMTTNIISINTKDSIHVAA